MGKLVVFGKLREVLPWLLRRVQENQDAFGAQALELPVYRSELWRRLTFRRWVVVCFLVVCLLFRRPLFKQRILFHCSTRLSPRCRLVQIPRGILTDHTLMPRKQPPCFFTGPRGPEGRVQGLARERA